MRHLKNHVCLHLGRGTPARSRWGGGTPARSRQGGVPQQGVPHLRYPPIRPGWGYPNVGDPTLGTPIGPGGYLHQIWMGVLWLGGTPPWVPPVRAGQGGTPPQVPSGQTWMEGYPYRGGTPPSSTWYAAVGMPLVFTQEDFLVYVLPWCLPRQLWNIESILGRHVPNS